jgi:hypothetical protein
LKNYFQDWRGIEFSVAYKDKNVITVKAFLSEDYLEGQLIVSYRNSHSVKLEYDLMATAKFLRAQHLGFHHINVALNYNHVSGNAGFNVNTLWTGDHSAEVNWYSTNFSWELETLHRYLHVCHVAQQCGSSDVTSYKSIGPRKEKHRCQSATTKKILQAQFKTTNKYVRHVNILFALVLN